MSLEAIFEFSEKDRKRKKNFQERHFGGEQAKQKVAGHVMAGLGLAALPAALPFLKLKGLDIKRSLRGYRAGLKKRLDIRKQKMDKPTKKKVIHEASTEAARETPAEKGKFLAEYMKGAEKAGDNVVAGPWMKTQIRKAQKRGDGFTADHYKAFREGKRTAHDHWNWERSKVMDDRAWKRGEHAAKMRKIADEHKWNDGVARKKPGRAHPYLESQAKRAEKHHKVAAKQRSQFGKGQKAFYDRMDGIGREKGFTGDYYDKVKRASAAKNLTKDEKGYIASLRTDKKVVGEAYKQAALASPALIATGGATAGHGYYKDYKGNGGRRNKKS